MFLIFQQFLYYLILLSCAGIPDLGRCLGLLLDEQSGLVGDAAATTLFASRLKQRLTVLKRHFIAVKRLQKPCIKKEAVFTLSLIHI